MQKGWIMSTQVVVVDLKSDGAIPVSADMFLDMDKDRLKITLDSIGIELWIRLLDIGNILGDELHG